MRCVHLAPHTPLARREFERVRQPSRSAVSGVAAIICSRLQPHWKNMRSLMFLATSPRYHQGPAVRSHAGRASSTGASCPHMRVWLNLALAWNRLSPNTSHAPPRPRRAAGSRRYVGSVGECGGGVGDTAGIDAHQDELACPIPPCHAARYAYVTDPAPVLRHTMAPGDGMWRPPRHTRHTGGTGNMCLARSVECRGNVRDRRGYRRLRSSLRMARQIRQGSASRRNT
jgi:hypothetical protein